MSDRGHFPSMGNMESLESVPYRGVGKCPLPRMMTLKELKSILKEYHLRPNKRLGQSFLIDQNIQKKIIDSVGLCKDERVLEIGPGLGALTEGLCKRAKKVIAIEKDKALYKFLEENFKFNNLGLLHTDILKFKFTPPPIGYIQSENSQLVWGFTDKHKIKIIGNLPYYISSPIITKLIENREFISSVFVSLQKEFADRLVAKPYTKAYSSISCFVQFYAETRILFTIKKTCFFPVPKVDSCFLQLNFREYLKEDIDEKLLFKIIHSAFGKRRKTILNSLYSSGIFSSRECLLEVLKMADIHKAARAEGISLDKFIKLSKIKKKF